MRGGRGESHVDSYVEPGGSWRPFWLIAAALAGLLVLDIALPGRDIPPLLWVVAIVSVLGVVAIGTVSARRVWTVRVEDEALVVGPERLPWADVDVAHLREITSGADTGAPVLGGGATLPRGRTGLPLRLIDGRSVLVPSRDPAALLMAVIEATEGRSGSQGTLNT
ncbi:MAG: hypothetical protein QOJ68_2049 [Blastococcus sp.]|nr:hypothetical protein [Blastococcus sp.]